MTTVEEAPPDPESPVLVVDEHQAVRSRLVSALEHGGMSTIEAANGIDALAIINQHPVSAVVLNNEMPAMSGASVLRTLRESLTTRTLPVLVVTGRESVDELVRGLEGGADDYLTTPVGDDDLVTRVRAQQHRQAAWTDAIEPLRRRLSATESLVGLDAGAGIDDIAAAVCDALITETGGPTAGLYMFASERRAVLLAGRGLPGRDAAPGVEISEVVSTFLFAKARQGPWSGQARDLPFDSGRPQRLPASINDRGFIVAPIVRDDHPIGIVFVGGPPGVGPLALGRRHFATLLDFAATSAMLLGAEFRHVSTDETDRDSLRDRYREHRFSTHFQPIAELASGNTVGYEALTRWDDGTRADLPFAEARRLDLALEMEIETIRAALTAAAELPSGAWLSVNISAETILEYTPLPELLTETRRSIVLELTEHQRIRDYEQLRSRLATLGRHVRVAVDDAGAGYSTLQHVLALQPAFVKLDLSWIRGIDQDRPRQAMITGLAHFAKETGSELIAEGVETMEEFEIMRLLGVTLGQGYLLGRPAPAAAYAAASDQHPSTTTRL
jgi:EAL domain-containing protein (putative c-di-GMP-specific phosphodiesterase class I)/DNA-binding NarL/FixJ family response regulator